MHTCTRVQGTLRNVEYGMRNSTTYTLRNYRCGMFGYLLAVGTRQWLNSAGMGRNGVLPPLSGVPPPEIAVPPPKVVAPLPGDAVPLP